MVQVASLRIQIEAQQAKQAAADVRRELDAVAVSATKADVSTDKLERQMEQLLAVTKSVAISTNSTAQGIERLAQRQQTAGVHVERTTERIVKQERAGSNLLKMFGSLATRTAATGGAFLAVDFLARVAGANSLLDGMNKILNSIAGSVRDLASGSPTFIERTEAAAKEATQSLDDYLDKLSKIKAAQYGPRVLLGGSDQFQSNYARLPRGADTNPYFAEQIGGAFDAYRAEQRNILRGGDQGDESTFALQRAQATLQARLDAIGAEYALLQRNLRAFAEEQKEAEKATSDWAQTLKRGAAAAERIEARQSARRGQEQAAAFGVPIASMFATPFIEYGQRQLQRQAYASDQPMGNSWDYQGTPGGAFTTGVVAASAQYAGQLAVIIQRQREAADTGMAFGDSVAGSIEDAVFSARNLEDGLEMVARSLTRIVFNQLVTQNLAAGIGGLFGGANAKGNVFDSGNVVPFAKGGVIAGPTFFPMAGGKTGLMGEESEEAIMPLGRDSQGRLGVRGGGSMFVFNITTPDVAGFRRSQRQIQSDMRRLAGGA